MQYTYDGFHKRLRRHKTRLKAQHRLGCDLTRSGLKNCALVQVRICKILNPRVEFVKDVSHISNRSVTLRIKSSRYKRNFNLPPNMKLPNERNLGREVDCGW